MAWPLSDTFTASNGTLITARSLSSGDSWAQHPAASGTATINNNRLESTGFTLFALYTVTTAPSSADYEVSADVIGLTGATGSVGITARTDSAARTGYELHMTSTGWVLYRLNAGSATSLASGSSTPANGVSKTIKLSVQGSVIKAYYDGAEVASVTDGSPVSSAGRAGLFVYDLTPPRLDNFAAVSLTVPAGPVARRRRPLGLYTR